VSNGVELSVSFPLDADGFLRRECPTCEREFKWRHSEDEGESEPMADSGYFCPYCAVQARPESWFTKPQQALVESAIHRKVVGPALDEFGRSEAVFPAFLRIRLLRLTFLGDPRVALKLPSPVPKTHPQRWLGQVARRLRGGVCSARSRCIQVFQRREAQQRKDRWSRLSRSATGS
jgi:hypothetical protein